jgi:hypothetical protein
LIDGTHFRLIFDIRGLAIDQKYRSAITIVVPRTTSMTKFINNPAKGGGTTYSVGEN